MDEDALVRTLARYHNDSTSKAPLTQEQLQDVETRLGFALPLLLRRIYGEAGNGGFGPHLLPLTMPGESLHGNMETVVAWYRGLRDNPPTEEERAELLEDTDPWTEWPERMLMISDWGCNIYSCVDCSQPKLPVLRNDNNISYSTFAVEAPSLREWLERWLDGENLFWLDWERADKITFP